MRRARRFVLVSVALVACGTDYREAQRDEPDAGADASTSAPADGGFDAGPNDAESGAPAPACREQPEQEELLAAVADTSLLGCGAISYGGMDVANLGAGPALVRFPVTAIANVTITSAALVLTSYPNCSDCGAGVPAQAGPIEAHAMRSDWVEGASGSNSGANLCRRMDSIDAAGARGWGSGDVPASDGTKIAAGPDYDAYANTATVESDAAQVEIPIRPQDVSARDAAKAGLVSFYVAMPAGRLVMATREAGPNLAPKLRVRYCP